MKTVDMLSSVPGGPLNYFKLRQSVIPLRVVFLALAVASLHGQDLDGSRAGVLITSGSANDWYRPPPVDPHPKFVILPETAGRLIVPVPPVNREKTISKLSNREFIELTPDGCRMLMVPFAADTLIDDAIKKEEEHVKQAARYLKRHPLDGSEFDRTYYSVLDGIAESKTKKRRQSQVLTQTHYGVHLLP